MLLAAPLTPSPEQAGGVSTHLVLFLVWARGLLLPPGWNPELLCMHVCAAQGVGASVPTRQCSPGGARCSWSFHENPEQHHVPSEGLLTPE